MVEIQVQKPVMVLKLQWLQELMDLLNPTAVLGLKLE